MNRWLRIAHPLLFMTAGVLWQFVNHPTTVETLVRPLLIMGAVAIAATFLFSAVVRSPTWGALLASAFVLITLRHVLPGLVLAVLPVWWLLVRVSRRFRRAAPSSTLSADTVTQAVSAYAVAYLVLAGVSMWQVADVTPSFTVPRYEVGSGTGGPNIYVLLLDGYPRADTLSSTFGIDNSEFADRLEDLGFQISQNATSNYTKTWLTMASMLNGAYVDRMIEGLDVPSDYAAQVRWMSALINEASLLDVLRGHGYLIETLPAAFRSTALSSADAYVDNGGITEFEVGLISRSPWLPLFKDQVRSFLSGAQRTTVLRTLEAQAELAEAGSEVPRFVLTHVLSPHTPYVLSPEGVKPASLAPCIPDACGFWSATIEELDVPKKDLAEALRLQLRVLNDRVTESVARVVAADPTAVVIVMSDHGSRYSLSDPDEQFRSFLATRTPGRESLFGQTESSVNILRKVIGGYMELSLASLPLEQWASHWTSPLDSLTRLDVPVR